MRSSFATKALGVLALVILWMPTNTQALTVSPVKLEMAGNPGQKIGGEFLLFNEQTEAKTFYSSFENFEAKGEEGTPVFKPGTEGLATWLQTSPEITLQPGEQATVPFTITIPMNVEAGGHFAAIFFGTTPTQANESGSQVSVGAKVGILVLLRVSGTITEGGGLSDFKLAEEQPFFESLPIAFTYRFSNNGGDRIKPDGDLVIRNMLGMRADSFPANPSQGNVLPGSTRKFEVSWEGTYPVSEEPLTGTRGFFEKIKRQWTDFALGRYTAELNLIYGETNTPAIESLLFWVFPWQLLIVLFGAVIIGGFILIKGIKTYNAWIIRMAKPRRAQKRRI